MTESRRLPRAMTSGGASVAVRLPVGAGTLAHRPTYRRIAPDNKYDQRTVVSAACAPQGAECRELSAGWADHLGALACTAPACFPDVDTENGVTR
ncbi:hypothetical protein [Micromonospora sp. CPCC 206060]|uniref:hypothetical protein n=1 Tax=Micromonospora sp. CPCC 206060 TaxID=3122406 RepID=UPI002FEE79C3